MDIAQLAQEFLPIQKDLARYDLYLELLKGSEWALKKSSKDYEEEFERSAGTYWLMGPAKDGIIEIGVFDGGGHYRTKKINLERFNDFIAHRDEAFLQAIEICKEKVAANKAKWEDRMLETLLEQLKSALLRKDAETAKEMYQTLLEKYDMIE